MSPFKLKPLLEKAGYRVIRREALNVFVPLGTRVAIANSYPNAIFHLYPFQLRFA